MVSALLFELLPVLFPKCKFGLIRQVPCNSEFSEPKAAFNEGFLNRSTHIQQATKTQERSKQPQSSCSRKKMMLRISSKILNWL